MVNTAQQGARFEREIIALLEEHGYDCIRSAASKGAVDIVAVAPTRDYAWTAQVLFIQAKLRKLQISPSERRAVLGLSLRAGALPLVASKVIEKGRKTYVFRELTGPGPKDWQPWTLPEKEN